MKEKKNTPPPAYQVTWSDWEMPVEIHQWASRVTSLFLDTLDFYFRFCHRERRQTARSTQDFRFLFRRMRLSAFLFRRLFCWIKNLLPLVVCFFRLLGNRVQAVIQWNMSLQPDRDRDDLDCEYDSTWEDEGEKDRPKQKKCHNVTRYYQNHRNMVAARDMQNYRHGYPKSNETANYTRACEGMGENMNLKFYLNKIPSVPDDVTIQEFHEEWHGDYERLEYVHSYIQWLFPLLEAGMNYCAYKLTKEEIEDFRKNDEAMMNLKTSYKLMLDFYGIQLVDEQTGEVRRAENWEERFYNLNRNKHNNLRITRILKCLGELGYEHYQVPLVQFFLNETLVEGSLDNVKKSVMDYFIFSVRDKRKRQELIKFAFTHYHPRREFVWCPRRIQNQLRGEEPNDERKDKLKHHAEGEPLYNCVDSDPQPNGRSPIHASITKGGGTPESYIVGEDDRRGTKPESTVNEAMRTGKAAVEALTPMKSKNKNSEIYKRHGTSSDRAIEPADKTDGEILPARPGPTELDCPTDESHHINATDAASQEILSKDGKTSAVTEKAAESHSAVGEEGKTSAVPEKAAESHSAVGEDGKTSAVPEKAAESHSVIGEEGKTSAVTEKVAESHSAVGEEGKTSAMTEKAAESHSAVGEEGKTSSVTGKAAESHSVVGEKGKTSSVTGKKKKTDGDCMPKRKGHPYLSI